MIYILLILLAILAIVITLRGGWGRFADNW